MLFHYTTGQTLQKILAAGKLEPRNSILIPSGRPIVWFTSRNEWEQTANAIVTEPGTLQPLPLGRTETAKNFGGLARIAVKSDHRDLMQFNKVCKRAQVDHAHRKAIVRLGERLGSRPVDQWWGSLQPVPFKEFAFVELFWLGHWKNINDIDPNDTQERVPEALV